MQDLIDRLGRHRVGDLAERPQPRPHVLGTRPQRLADHVRRLLGVIVGKALYILVGAIIGVRTSGMWIVVKVTPSPTTSEATTRVNASSAALEAT